MNPPAKRPQLPAEESPVPLTSQTLTALDQAVHVWMLPPLDAAMKTSLADLQALLSEDERLRERSFHFAANREAFVANRGRLRLVLAHYLSCRPEHVQFIQGPQGKPELENGNDHGLTFNLSHTDGLAVAAVTRRRRVGVDVERMKAIPDILDIARYSFSTNEYRQLASLPAAEQPGAFYACWTRKEAFVKGLGTGLAQNLAEFEVSLLPGEPAALLTCRWSPELCRSWRLYSLDAGDGHACALAFEQDPHHSPLDLQTFTWSALETPALGPMIL